MARQEGINLAQQYAQQAQQEAYRSFAPVVPHEAESQDGEIEESTRGEEWSDMISCLTAPLLRLGFSIQLLVLIFGFALFYGHGGRGVFTFDLHSTHLRTNESYTRCMILLESCYLVGVICVAKFQIYVADNSKTTRGFRAGSKLLSTAAMLDMIVVGFRLMQYIYLHKFLSSRWWMKYAQSNSDWCVCYSAALLDCIALFLYGLSVFYMEAYHDEGTYEEWAWLVLGLYWIAGLFEFLLVFTGFGAFHTAIQVFALLAAVIWSCSFEPLTHYSSPMFHDRDLDPEIAAKEEDTQQTEPAIRNYNYAPHT